MYKIIPWSDELDLTAFYTTAAKKGFVNNSTKSMLVDSLAKEKEWGVWILYYNDKAIGSVGAHSFPEMGNNDYRIAVRTCVFTDELPEPYSSRLHTINGIITHQNPTAQFLIPTCINWVPTGSNIYITSNESPIGTQRKVHNIFGPALEKSGQLKKITNIKYRGTMQTVWQLYPDKFLKELEKYDKW